MIASRKPFKALKHLAVCSSELYEALQNWANSQNLIWPTGYLDSLLVFGQFMQRIAATGVSRFCFTV